MKSIRLVLTIATFVTFGIGQVKTVKEQKPAPRIVLDTEFSVKEMAEVLAKAKWEDVFEIKGADEVVSIDTNVMMRIQDVVFFRERYVKRGTIFYSTYAGNCSEDKLQQYNRFATYPGKPKLVKLEVDSGWYPVAKGTMGYGLLDYVCENASVQQ